ncbi:MAG: DUF177 domain-containing protein [Oscillospiraceae bacterium]|nr:DUF177 domain-containing protein [Oscillospiraceae bacterium]
MQFDLKRLLLRGPDYVCETFESDLSGCDWPGYRVDKPVSAEFSVRIKRSELYLSLRASAEVQGECARCLDPVSETIELEREWKVREDDLAGEDELPVDAKGVLDLDELLFEELVLEGPSLLLCSEDCSGLCPECGLKKAAGCTCQPAEEEAAPVDPRLAILRELLD